MIIKSLLTASFILSTAFTWFFPFLLFLTLISTYSYAEPRTQNNSDNMPSGITDSGFTSWQWLNPPIHSRQQQMQQLQEFRSSKNAKWSHAYPHDITMSRQMLSPDQAQGSQSHEGFSSWQWLNPLPQGNDLYDVCIVDSNVVVAVGWYGTIVRSVNSGVTWEVGDRTGGLATILMGVDFSSRDRGIVVGGKADVNRWASVIFRTTNGGGTWIEQPVPHTRLLLDVRSIDDQTMIAVGDSGTILLSIDGGITWSLQESGTLDILKGITFANRSLGFIVGDSGTILRTTDAGMHWDKLASGITEALYSLTVVDTAQVFATGAEGTLLRTTNGGDSWELMYPWYGYPWYGVTFIGFTYRSNQSWTVIGTYAMLQTTDGGNSWSVQLYPSCVQSLLYSTAIKSNLCYAVGLNGILIRSTDSGVSWECQSHGPTVGLSELCMVDPQLGMAVGDLGTLVKTTDGGVSWSHRFLDTLFRDLKAITFPSDSVGYSVGDQGMIWKTLDAGETWFKQASGTETNLRRVSFSDDSVGVAIGDSAVLRTTDGGQTWTGLSGLPSIWLWTGVSCIDRNTIVVVGRDYPWWGWIVRSTDGGITWTAPVSYSYDIFNAVDFSDSQYGTAIGSGIWRTTDGGASWIEQQAPGLGSFNDVLSLSDQVIIVVGEGVVGTTNGGSTWFSRETPVHKYFNSVSFSHRGGSYVVYAVGGGGAIMCAALSPLNPKTWTWTGLYDSSWNNSSNWIPVGVPLPGDSVIIPSAVHSPIIDSVQQQIVIASLNILSGGKLTITDALPRFIVLADATVYGTLEIRPPAATTIIVGGNWTIEPGGSSERFAYLSKPTSNPLSDEGFVPSRSTVLFSGSGIMAGNFYNLMFDTTSSMRSNGNIFLKNQCMLVGDLDLDENDTLFVEASYAQALIGQGKFTKGTVNRTIESGSIEPYGFESSSSYIQLDSSGTYPATVAITTLPDTNPTSFGNRWSVVPSSVDTAANVITADSVTGFSKWVFGIPRPSEIEGEFELYGIDDTIPLIRRVYDINAEGGSEFKARLALRYDQSEVPVGIQEDSLKLLRLESTVDMKEKLKELPKEFSLSQNYPNPFNPSTAIRYELPVASFVTMKVYNLLGQEVASLVNEKKEAGGYEVNFHANNLPSGVYFYRMQAGGYKDVNKFLLMR